MGWGAWTSPLRLFTRVLVPVAALEERSSWILRSTLLGTRSLRVIPRLVLILLWTPCLQHRMPVVIATVLRTRSFLVVLSSGWLRFMARLAQIKPCRLQASGCQEPVFFYADLCRPRNRQRVWVRTK